MSSAYVSQPPRPPSGPEGPPTNGPRGGPSPGPGAPSPGPAGPPVSGPPNVGPPPGPTPNGYGARGPGPMPGQGGPPMPHSGPPNPHTVQRVSSSVTAIKLELNSQYSLQMLDENAALIKTISEYQNVGKHSETVQYQWSLHRNLMYLASIADANQNLQNLLPVRK